jgi:hypothetical protein
MVLVGNNGPEAEHPRAGGVFERGPSIADDVGAQL